MSIGSGQSPVFWRDTPPEGTDGYEVVLVDPDGRDLPRVAEFVAQQLNRDYGTEYTRALTLAVEYAAAGEQARFRRQLRVATTTLCARHVSHRAAKELAVEHVDSILGALRADLQQGS